MIEHKVTPFGVEMYEESYLMQGETIPELYHRVAYANCGDNPERAERIKTYFHRLWFCGATPVMSNSGNGRGDPISCFTAETFDDKGSISYGIMEDFVLGSRGGGIGRRKTMRGVGEKIANVGRASGKVPFYKLDDAAVNAVSQGALRRASKAEYLHISDPEIEEFLEIRKPTGGDANRKCFNLHHGVVIDDEFMVAVLNEDMYPLKSVKDGSIVRYVDAYTLFTKLLTVRIETGEPYILFEDNVNNQVPQLYKLAAYKVKLSNLCCEIVLHTSENKTAVCCLSSVNLATYDEWKDDPLFIEDVMYFLDGVLIQYLHKLENAKDWEKPYLQKVINFVKEERAVGLGVMGWHDLLQSKMIPFESPMAKGLNIKIFRDLREKVDKASIKIGQERGACELAVKFGLPDRFTHKLSVAPTASISILTGEASAGIEPRLNNAYTHKNKIKAQTIKNKYFNKYLLDYAQQHNKDGRWVAAQWKSVVANDGSVQHLDWVDNITKDVFKTAFEIDQRYILEQAADRQVYIDQSQSVNIFLRHDIHKRDLLGLHLMAWFLKLKGLYYCRSTSPKRANVGVDIKRVKLDEPSKYTECLSCQ